MALKINWQKWQSLTDDERNSMLALDIEAPKPPKRGFKVTRIAMATSVKPYVLKQIISCQLCHKSTATYFNMVPYQDDDGKVGWNQSEPIKPCKPYKINDSPISSCGQCTNTLMGWEKEDLIKLLIKNSHCTYIGKLVEGGGKIR